MLQGQGPEDAGAHTAMSQDPHTTQLSSGGRGGASLEVLQSCFGELCTDSFRPPHLLQFVSLAPGAFSRIR